MFRGRKRNRMYTVLNCVEKNIKDIKPELDEMIDKDSNISEYDQEIALGEQLFFDIRSGLIHDCDIYYGFF